MLHCWVENARERPPFSFLHSRLLDEYNELKKDETVINNDRVFQPQCSSSSMYSDSYVSQPSSSSVTDNDDPLSADNSRSVLLPQDTSDNAVSKTSNCDLVLTANASSDTQANMELLNALDSFGHSLPTNDAYLNGNGEELFTKL